jgi:hypothetical protein
VLCEEEAMSVAKPDVPDAGFSDKAGERAEQMHRMWNAHWYGEFEIPNTVPDDARLFELDCDRPIFRSRSASVDL